MPGSGGAVPLGAFCSQLPFPDSGAFSRAAGLLLDVGVRGCWFISSAIFTVTAFMRQSRSQLTGDSSRQPEAPLGPAPGGSRPHWAQTSPSAGHWLLPHAGRPVLGWFSVAAMTVTVTRVAHNHRKGPVPVLGAGIRNHVSAGGAPVKAAGRVPARRLQLPAASRRSLPVSRWLSGCLPLCSVSNTCRRI